MLSKRFYYFLAIAMFFAQTLFAGKPVFGKTTEIKNSNSTTWIRTVYVDGVVLEQTLHYEQAGRAWIRLGGVKHFVGVLKGYNVLPDECFKNCLNGFSSCVISSGCKCYDKYISLRLTPDEISKKDVFGDKSDSSKDVISSQLRDFIEKMKAHPTFQGYFEEGMVPGEKEATVEKSDSFLSLKLAMINTEERVKEKENIALLNERLNSSGKLTLEEKEELIKIQALYPENCPTSKQIQKIQADVRTKEVQSDYGLSDREKENIKKEKERLAQEHSDRLAEAQAKMAEENRLLVEKHSKELEEKERLKNEELSKLAEEQKQTKKELEQNKTAMEEEKKRLVAEKAQLEAAHLEKIKEYEQHKLEAEEKLKNEQAKALREKNETQKKIDAMKAAGASQADIDAATADMDKKFKDAEEKMRKEKEESDKALLEEKSKAEKLQKDLEAATAANKEALEKMAKDHDALSKNLEEQKNEIEKTKTEAARLKKEFEEAQNSSAKDKEKLAEIEKKEQEKSDLLKKFKDELPKSPSMTVDQLKSYKSCGLDDLLKAIKESSLDDKTKKELQKNLAQAFELPVQEDSPAGSDSPKPEPWSLPAKIGFVSVGAGALYLGAKLLSRMYVNKNVDAKSSPLNRKEDKKIAEVK